MASRTIAAGLARPASTTTGSSRSAPRCCRSCWRRSTPPTDLLYRQQLDVEHQHALGRAGAGRVVVREVARDPEAGLLADHHQLYALGPARDHAVEREAGGHAARDRAVEHLAVGLPARVV